MLSLNFICRESKVNRFGLAPVELSIILDGVRTYMLLPRRERPEDFRRLMAQKRGNDLKSFCDAMYKRVQGAISEMYVKGLDVSPKTIKQYLKGEYSSVYSVRMLVDDFFGILKKRIDVDLSLATYFKYERVAERLISKVGGNSDVSVITKAVVLDFVAEMKQQYEAATVSGYYTKLKSLIRFAIDNGKLSINPCNGVKVPKGEKEIKILSDSDYVAMRDKVFYIARLEKVRDLAVFAANSGLAYCDIVQLKKEDFTYIDGRWVIDKERQKTKVRFYSVILDDGVKILEKYNYDLSCLFLSNQKTNSYLSEIQDVCGISSVPSLHFHLFRHLYCTKLIRMGLPVSVVQLAVGHKNIKQTAHYTHLCAQDVVSAVNCKC